MLFLPCVLCSLYCCGDEEDQDSYWVFNEESHFKPSLDRGEFYKLTGEEFIYFVTEPLYRHVTYENDEPINLETLSPIQKLLYYWGTLHGQIENGGIVQYYLNDHGKHIPIIIKGLRHVGDTSMAQLISEIHYLYKESEDVFNESGFDDLFGGGLRQRMDKLDSKDNDFYELLDNTLSIIENYIRKNPDEVGRHSDGEEFDPFYTGPCSTMYNDNTIKEEFNLEEGRLSGTYTKYHRNGKKEQVLEFAAGKATGIEKVYNEEGTMIYEVYEGEFDSVLVSKWYYTNGNPKKLETKSKNGGQRIGGYKEWYENGQLWKAGTYKSHYALDGDWIEYYENGSKRLVAKYAEGVLIPISFWMEDGRQIMTNGTGVYLVQTELSRGEEYRSRYEYRGYKKEGLQQHWMNGVIRSTQEMKNGKLHGISKNYYDNGRLKSETYYNSGEVIRVNEFRKFINPRVVAQIKAVLCHRCYEEIEGYPSPDNEPKILNNVLIAESFVADAEKFEQFKSEDKLEYSYHVLTNDVGEVVECEFAYGNDKVFDSDIRLNIKKLKFETARMESLPVSGIFYVTYTLCLTEEVQ